MGLGGVGRDLEGTLGVSKSSASVLVSWSKSKGFYGGVSFEGRVFKAHNAENRRYYKDERANAKKVLKGDFTIRVPDNPDYTRIVKMLKDSRSAWEQGHKVSEASYGNLSLHDMNSNDEARNLLLSD